MEDRSGWLKEHIRDVHDFPRAGVTFKDITPLLADPSAFAKAISELAGQFRAEKVDKVLGIEARGFIVAAPVALELGAGFVPIRKAGKLPWEVQTESYELEYGTDTLEMHSDAVAPGERVLIVDDVLATGGTAAAVSQMVDRTGAEPVGFAFVLELAFLGGRGRLGDAEAFSLMTYD